MKKRIYRSVFLASIAVLLIGLAIIMSGLYDYLIQEQFVQLGVEAQLAAQGVANEGMAYFENLDIDDCRITWVDADGKVLYDSAADSATMENHAGREEIKSAFETGFGESSRESETLTRRQLYSARLLPDGTVIRASSTQYTRITFLALQLKPLVLVIIVAVILSLLFASRLSKQIVKPINEIDLDEPLANETYEELAPFLTRIERQHRQINSQSDELKRKCDEFEAVTGSMNEGLVLLNEKDIILSMNKSAASLLCADSACIGRNIVTVNRSLGIQELLEKSKKIGRAEMTLELSGGKYQLNASAVVSGGETAGVALLFFDVTEKMNAEQVRREFTANVSHELKTPLHSISGCAEMIQNGMVKREDVPQFVGQIYTKAQHMIALVDDIIHLSRIDEGVEDLPREEVNILELATEAAARFASNAEEKRVTLTVKGDDTSIRGIEPLLRELVNNLCDNAVKYNRDGGRVELSVKDEGETVVLIVADTGIGIPAEHQSRIFERFYRVDKSHSKESGGTGLGLSIVKHAARLHGADIKLQSAQGKGTTISVRFPK